MKTKFASTRRSKSDWKEKDKICFNILLYFVIKAQEVPNNVKNTRISYNTLAREKTGTMQNKEGVGVFSP